MKSLKEQLADLEDPAPPKELDPESHDVFAGAADSGSEDEAGETEFNGREHYEAVGKSKLRKPAQPSLGKQYAGASVSRAALDQDDDESAGSTSEDEDEDDDPFAKGSGSDVDDVDDEENSIPDEDLLVDGEVDEDDEIDSDEAFGSGDEERFQGYTFRGSSKNKKTTGSKGASITNGVSASDEESEDLEEEMEDLDVSDDEEDLEGEDSEGESDIDMEDEDLDQDDLEDDDETDATSDDEAVTSKPTANPDRAALRALMSSDTKEVASAISAAASADAHKGRAVKEQYQTFDKLIDLRIKLQKGVTAANSLPTEQIEDTASLEAIKKAEAAALQLFSTLESLRHDFLDVQETNPKKRKRPSPATTETSTSKLWTRTQSLETQSRPLRRSILDKWSTKVRASTVTSEPRSRLLQPNSSSSGASSNLTTVIDAYLTTHNTPTTTTSYDDTPFYQSLLLSLLSSKNSSTTGTVSAATVLPSAINRPKTHRPNLDTKASKGRKIRYTVHEKLMNFGAPEGVTGGGEGRWGDGAKDEFFGSLFGGQRVLDEDEEGEEMGDIEDGGDEGLRLF